MQALCATAAAEALQRYGWQLLDRDTLTTLAVERLDNPDGGAPAARAAVLAAYSVALHRACTGDEGRPRQEQGYAELCRMLYRMAYQRYPATYADDIVQRALERLYRTQAQCRTPEAFLAFALQKLRDAARAELRQMDSAGQAVDMIEPDQAPTMDIAEAVLACDFRRRLTAYAQGFIQQYPRAAQQLTALWLRHIEGLDDVAIGRRFGNSAAAVQVMRSRALRRLRREAGWQQFAAELGLWSEDPAHRPRGDEAAHTSIV